MQELSQEEYIERLVPLLEQNPIFSDFPKIAEFAGRADFGFFEQGTRICKQNEPGETFYVVISGQLRALNTDRDPPQLLNYLPPGSIFGMRAVYDNTVRSATVEVVVDSHLAIYHKNDWDWLIHQNDRLETYFRNQEREWERTDLDFPGRQWDEVVAIAVKRHILALLAKLTSSLLLLIVPVLFLIAEEMLGFTFLQIITDNLFWTVLATMPFILLSVTLAIYNYLDWRNDDFIVTTKRAIHIERILLYGEQRDEAPLVRIQDVTVVIHNLLSRFFDFHDLEIKTAGAGTIKIDGFPRCEEIRTVIFREQEKAKARVSAADLAAIRQMIAGRLDWEEALEKPVMAVAEDPATITTQKETHRLPFGLEYFWPRMRDVTEAEGTTAIVWRKHYYILIRAIFLPVIALLISLYLFISSFFGGSIFGFELGWLLFGFITLACIVWYLWRYDGWRKDLYMVTDRRIIDIEGTPFRLRGEKRREGSFDNVQNITYDIPNFVSKLLNMGDVVIETAGTERTFTFDHVFNPSGIQEEVFHRMVLFQQRQREQARDATTDRLVEVVAEYHRLSEKTSHRK